MDGIDVLSLSPEFWLIVFIGIIFGLITLTKVFNSYINYKTLKIKQREFKLKSTERDSIMSMINKSNKRLTEIQATSASQETSNDDIVAEIFAQARFLLGEQAFELAKVAKIEAVINGFKAVGNNLGSDIVEFKEHVLNLKDEVDEDLQLLLIQACDEQPEQLMKMLNSIAKNGNDSHNTTEPNSHETNREEIQDIKLTDTNSLSEDQRKEKLEELKNSSERSDVENLIFKYQCLKDIIVKHLNGSSSTVIITDYSLELLMKLDDEIDKKLKAISEGNLDGPKLVKIKTFVNSVIECHN